MAASPAQDIQGPFLIGLTINIFLYGVATVQAYLYFTNYKSDALWLRSLLVILYLVETLNSAISIYYIYDVLITHYGDEASLLTSSWIFTANAILMGVIGGGVQHFFAWRVYVLTKNVLAVAAIVLCSLVSVAGCLAATIRFATNANLAVALDIESQLMAWLVGAVLADTAIAVSLVWYLQKRKHLYPVLSSTINRILRMTVQTGVLTTIIAVIDLTCYLAISSSIYLIFSMTLSKLYTNCMLSTLNARGAWKFDRSLGSEVSHGRSNYLGSVVFQPQRTQPEVFLQAESYEMTDTGDKPSHGIFGHGDTKHGRNDEEVSTNASQV
ncbi:hypothetical protein EDC04DRAFT_3113858 [Pisolithus marmoratus]|nr:hypothetical protein EDC04DRAFT_3113858 [Pisolithus marmoratus]